MEDPNKQTPNQTPTAASVILFIESFCTGKDGKPMKLKPKEIEDIKQTVEALNKKKQQ